MGAKPPNTLLSLIFAKLFLKKRPPKERNLVSISHMAPHSQLTQGSISQIMFTWVSLKLGQYLS